VISKTYYVSPNSYTLSGCYVSVTSQLWFYHILITDCKRV